MLRKAHALWLVPQIEKAASSERSATDGPDDHACGDGVVGLLIHEDEAAGGAVLGIGVEEDRRGAADADAADVIERELLAVLVFSSVLMFTL